MVYRDFLDFVTAFLDYSFSVIFMKEKGNNFYLFFFVLCLFFFLIECFIFNLYIFLLLAYVDLINLNSIAFVIHKIIFYIEAQKVLMFLLFFIL